MWEYKWNKWSNSTQQHNTAQNKTNTTQWETKQKRTEVSECFVFLRKRMKSGDWWWVNWGCSSNVADCCCFVWLFGFCIVFFKAKRVVCVCRILHCFTMSLNHSPMDVDGENSHGRSKRRKGSSKRKLLVNQRVEVMLSKFSLSSLFCKHMILFRFWNSGSSFGDALLNYFVLGVSVIQVLLIFSSVFMFIILWCSVGNVWFWYVFYDLPSPSGGFWVERLCRVCFEFSWAVHANDENWNEARLMVTSRGVNVIYKSWYFFSLWFVWVLVFIFYHCHLCVCVLIVTLW